jgi:predicted TIM-barrel fold metal-dependent hydrolase
MDSFVRQLTKYRIGIVMNSPGGVGRRALLMSALGGGVSAMMEWPAMGTPLADETQFVMDSHHHLILPSETHIRMMDEAKIAKAVLLVARPHPERAVDIAEFKREMAVLAQTTGGGRNTTESVRRAMEDVHKTLALYPDRFIAFGQVPLGGSAVEIGNWVQTEIVDRGLKGIGELVVVPGNGKSIEPVLKAASDHGGRLPVLVHAYAPQTQDDIRTFAALAGEYPSVPVIMGQLGGPNWLDAIEILKASTPNLKMDLSTPVTWFASYLAAREIPERILFASNAPYGDMVVERLQAERAITRAQSSVELRNRIMGGTLASLVGLA